MSAYYQSLTLILIVMTAKVPRIILHLCVTEKWNSPHLVLQRLEDKKKLHKWFLGDALHSPIFIKFDDAANFMCNCICFLFVP